LPVVLEGELLEGFESVSWRVFGPGRCGLLGSPPHQKD
jgi:hypothetical protein